MLSKLNLEKFLVANRVLGFLSSSMSIASAWIWAPALFISAEVAYKWGVPGLLWFLIPNVMTLGLFSYFGKKLRDIDDSGYTLSSFIKDRVSPGVQKYYIFELLLLSICAISVQIIAGSSVLHTIFPAVDSIYFSLLLGLVPLGYISAFGLKASVMVDAVQYLLMLSILAFITFFMFHLPEVSLAFTGKLNIDSTTLLLSFGIPTTIGLLSGAFGSQDFFQRAYAVKKEFVGRSFLLASGLFVVIPVMISMLGFIALGGALPITNTFLTNISTISHYGGAGMVYLFSLAIIGALVSTIDSAQSSASAIIGYDIHNMFNVKMDSVLFSRLGILLVTCIAILIATSGVTVLQLFLTYGAIRSSIFGVTLVSIGTTWKLNAKLIQYSLYSVLSLLVPLNIYAILNKIPQAQALLAILIVLVPAIVAITTADKRVAVIPAPSP